MHDTTLFTQMVGMILLNFIKGNVHPTMLDKVQSILSFYKPTIDTYTFGLFKLQSASSNDEHQQEENHEENVHKTTHNTADGEGNTSDDEEYTLPFKVLGSAHRKEMEVSLEHNILAMNEQQKQVTARLQPEITNDYNSNAISVQFRSTRAKVLKLLVILPVM